MAGPFALGGIAGIGNSFMKSYQAERDRIRQETKEAADQAWQNELRGRQRKAWEQEAAEQQAIARAMQPVESEPVYQVTDQAGSSAQTDDADAAQVMRDMAETKNGGAAVENKARVNGVVHSYPGAQKALSEANSPHRQQLRAADALAAINPKRSIEMRNQAMQSRSSELTLNKQERDEINDTFNTALVQTLDSQPNWWDGAVQIAQSAGGVNLVPEVSEDGQKVRLYQVDEKGGRKLRGSYATSEEGKLTFLDQASRQDYKSKVAILRANMEYQRSRRDAAEDREADLAGRQSTVRLQHSLQQGASAKRDAEAAANAQAAVNLFVERNPGASQAEIEAVRRGVLPAVPKKPEGYKVEAGDVTTLLGTPATDANGNALVDPMTGRQVVNRNPTREREFFEFMRKNQITDTNEALQKFLAPTGGASGGGKSSGRTISKGQVVGGYEFLGGNPNDEKSWRKVSAGKVQ